MVLADTFPNSCDIPYYVSRHVTQRRNLAQHTTTAAS